MCFTNLAEKAEGVVDELQIWSTGLFHHLAHSSAFLSAVSASLCTSSHLLVVREFFACCGAIIAALDTAFTRMSTEITLTGTK
jgi:hypothetical protein